MELGEQRRRTAISEASDKLWRGDITRSAFLRVCAGAGIGLAGLGLSRPRRATAAPPTIQDIRATAVRAPRSSRRAISTSFFGT